MMIELFYLGLGIAVGIFLAQFVTTLTAKKDAQKPVA